MASALPEVWFLVVGLLLLLYVVLDGADLGAGILSLLLPDEERRGILMAGVAGVWHANQTWLVIVGGMLFGVFPLAYGVVFSALYVPLMVLVFTLVARGVALEFRESARHPRRWSLVFGLGSLATAVTQGLALGGFLAGFRVEGGHFAGGSWDWLNPLCALTAVGVVCGYTLLGATHAVAKTEGELQAWCRRAARWSAAGAAAAGVASCAGAALLLPHVAAAWTSLPGAPIFGAAWIGAVAAGVLLFRSLAADGSRAPFAWSALAVALAFAVLAAGVYPLAIPPAVTVAEAAAPENTLLYMLVVVGALIPVMLLYNAYLYRVFRGKASGSGYEG
ncbi:MAG: cytochrome d ubiquinol oxidase subunit II [Deltaproteobacteria bacterium]|nr:cytochrome d ubiquinol oxidase subunit II [Deltaproteobacteria bacterium]